MKKRVSEILEDIKKLYKELEQIQNSCTHENCKVTPRSNTDNYDPSDNYYWVEVNCLDCRWIKSFDSVKEKEYYYKYCGKI